MGNGEKINEAPATAPSSINKSKANAEGLSDILKNDLPDKFNKFVDKIKELDIFKNFGKFLEKIASMFGINLDSNKESTATAKLEKVAKEKRLFIGASNYVGLSKRGYGITSVGGIETAVGGKNMLQIYRDMLGMPGGRQKLIDKIQDSGVEQIVLSPGNNDTFAEIQGEPTPEKIKNSKFWQQFTEIHDAANEAVPGGVYIGTLVDFKNSAMSYYKKGNNLEHKIAAHKAVNELIYKTYGDKVLDFHSAGVGNGLHPPAAAMNKVMDDAMAAPNESNEAVAKNVKPKEVFAFGDSLTVGAAQRGGYDRTERSAKAGISSGELLSRTDEMQKAKNRGAKKIMITVGANDGGGPNLENIKKIISKAKNVFGAKNVWLADVPVYIDDPKYKKNFEKNPNLLANIRKYNRHQREEFPDINLFHYETNGLLHPKSYQPIAKVIDRELGVERANA